MFVLIILAVLSARAASRVTIVFLPFAFAIIVLYGVYRLVWMSVQAISGGRRRLCAGMPSASAAMPRGASPAAAARLAPLGRREKAVPALVLKPPRERLAELLGSLLGSSLVAAAMCVVMVLIETFRADAAGVPRPEQFAWLLLVSVAGSWAVLIPSKFWEGIRGDPMARRFLLMVIGMGVGAAAFWAERIADGGPAAGGRLSPAAAYKLPPSFYALDGRPLLMAYVACFGTLFLLVRWWLQSRPVAADAAESGDIDVERLVAGWWRGRGSSRSPGCRWSPPRSPCRCSWPARGDGRGRR